MSRILLGVGGGIAAFKVAGLASMLVQAGHDVRAAMTSDAMQFVGKTTFAGLTGRTVIERSTQIDPDGSRGFMRDAFNFLTSKKARAEALEKLHRVDQRNLGKREREAQGAAVNAIKADRSALLSQANRSYNADQIALLERQAFENDQLKAKWHQRTAERKRAYDAIVKKFAAKRSAKATPEAEAKEDFTRAAKPRRRRSRGRSRKRTRD